MGKLKIIVLAAAVCLLWAGWAQASEGHEPRWGDFAWRILNLIIFCGILWYFTGGLIKRFFHNRKQNIQDTLNELESRKEEAKKKLSEIETRIADLESERKAILDESQLQADRLKKSILDDAHKQASQIVEQARRSAENEGRAMMDQVRSQVADEIVDAASRALQGKLSQEDHEQLISNALDKVVLQ